MKNIILRKYYGKKFKKKIAHLITGASVIFFASAAYAGCTYHTTCVGNKCSTVEICTTDLPDINP